MFAGAAAGVAVAAVAVVVVTGGDEKQAAAPTSVISTTTGSSAVPPTTAPGATGRGLDGAVEIVAGNGSDDGGGRPGPAADASLGSQAKFAVAPNGDVFAVSGTPVLLLIHDGTVEEIYTGTNGESGFGGVAVGPDGDAYVTMSTGVKRIAADGSSELVVDADAEGLNGPFGPIAFDGAGSFYFYDATTYRVLRHAPGGGLSQVAGTGTQAAAGAAPGGDDGPALASPLGSVVGLVVDEKGNLLIADVGSQAVRSVAADGTISTVAGGGSELMSPATGAFAADGTAATDLKIGNLTGVAVDGEGRVYVSDGGSHVIVRFEPGAGIELVIGDQTDVTESTGRPANQTRVRNVGGLAVDAAGDLVFLDTNVIRRIVGAAR
jgi:sugar lactone lactonase YvrE